MWLINLSHFICFVSRKWLWGLSFRTATKVSEMLGNVNTSSALSAFERMEEKGSDRIPPYLSLFSSFASNFWCLLSFYFKYFLSCSNSCKRLIFCLPIQTIRLNADPVTTFSFCQLQKYNLYRTVKLLIQMIYFF